MLNASGSRLRIDRGQRRPGDLAKTTAPVVRPDWLSDAERAVWEYYFGLLSPLGLVTAADVDSLAYLCVLCVQIRETAALARQAVLVETDSGEKPNPATRQLMQLLAQWRPMAASFGLTPGDRLVKGQGDGDALDKLFKLGAG